MCFDHVFAFFFFFPTWDASSVYRKLLSNRKHLICTCI